MLFKYDYYNNLMKYDYYNDLMKKYPMATAIRTVLNKCSDNRTDRPTDRAGHRQVLLPTMFSLVKLWKRGWIGCLYEYIFICI